MSKVTVEQQNCEVIEIYYKDHGTGVGLLLTDQRARVLARRTADHDTAGLLDRVQLAPGFGYGEEQVGTNAIGTAIAGRGPALVAGQDGSPRA